MEELLNLLQVKLCNCDLKDEDLVKIKEYIEKGNDYLDLSEIHKYNIQNALRCNYKIREDLWKLMDEFIDNEEVVKRILNVFFSIGQESFFNIITNRFYSITKTGSYLRPIENKERLLIWLIKNCSNYVKETIIVVEEMIAEDKEILLKAFIEASDEFVKLVLAILAIKNSCKLLEDGEAFVKQHLKNGEDINKYLRDKQIALVQFLAYAHSKSQELRGIVRNTINKSSNNRKLFDQLVSFICFYDTNAQSYDIAKAFDIDEKLYVLRLIKLYIRDENRKVLKEIKEKIKEIPLVFRESLEFINKSKFGENNLQDIESFVLSFFIYKDSRKAEDFEKLKQGIKSILRGFIYSFKGFEVVARLERAKIVEYVMEGKNEECIGNYIARIEEEVVEGHLWDYHGFCFKLIYSMDETREIIYRFLYLVINVKKYDLGASIIDKIIESQSMSYVSFAKELKVAGISEEHLILTADRALNQYNFKSGSKTIEYLRKLCEEGNGELIKYIDDLHINVKEIVLENLFVIDNEKYLELLVNHLSDDSKVIRDKVVKLLSSYEGCMEKVLSNLTNRKIAVREAAVRILINFDMRDFTDTLEKFAEKEKNEKVKILILNIINSDHLDEEILKSAESISDYCTERLKKTDYAAPEWIPVSRLSEVKYEDGNLVSKDVIIYLISKYSIENIVKRNLTAEKVIKKCNKQYLDQIGNEILSIWINNGADKKQKWILALISAMGGFNVVNTLKTQIDIWSKSSRGSIACDAIQSLALNGSDEALIIIDTIARKFKHKQIKKAAEEAFVSAAKMLNLTEEDLADKIIPDLDFDIRGERVFDYGSRSFTVTLELDFSLKITGGNEKVIKTLPKPNKSDDELKAKEALAEFKILKKQIKTTVYTQNLRLERALSVNRIWKKKDWEKLFVKNPIMHNFSLGLVWGVYENGQLKNTFRYMEDGTFNTHDEEEYELLEDTIIGLVHPLEIEGDTLENWNQQFEDYEIVQPFSQLQRKIYRVTEEEKDMKSIERFAGTKINGLSLVGNLTKMGWYRGSVQDGGGYSELYKEDERAGIGAELNFDWLGVGCEDEETIIYELIFYKANTVERGSYVYDEVTEENTISPAKVLERFFSEILYDVDRALEVKTGFATNWRLDR